MRNTLFCRLQISQRISRKFHSIPKNVHGGNLQGSNRRAEERNSVCIYRVPIDIRDVEPKAYSPSIISIGPYYHGEERLQEMEELKWKFFHRLIDSPRPNGVKLDKVMTDAMQELEQEARSCYWGKIQHSSENFVKMMLIDGCFVVELFKELKQHDFVYAPSIQRWMLPALRRDLIMLENQLPLFVLEKLFELTSSEEESSISLRDLALHFFTPLLQRDTSLECINREANGRHFLDLFRSSILPKVEEDSWKSTENRGVKTNMMRSVTELNEAGIKIKKGKRYPLDVRLERRIIYKSVLKIPPLYIDDYKGTLFRNMVAFEQCHHECRLDVTSYLSFIDGLINSVDDVELLHHSDVINHSLGTDKEVARLVNSLCKEIANNGFEYSYLRNVVYEANNYYYGAYARVRAPLVHHYLSNLKIGISTVAGIIILYATLIQAGYAAGTEPSSKKLTLLECIENIGDPLCLQLGLIFSSLEEFFSDESLEEFLDLFNQSILDPLSGGFGV